MRILVANSFHYLRGGDSAQFLDHVDALERRGHQVAVFSMRYEQNLPSRWSEYWAPRVEYRGALTSRDRVHASWRSIHSAESGRRMARLLRDFRPDVVHFHSVHVHLTLSIVQACISATVPTVWTLHDFRCVCPATSLLRGDRRCERCRGGGYWHCVAGRCKAGELSRSLAATVESYFTQFRGTLGKVECYIAPSRFLGRKVLAMGLPARRLEVVPNPVQVEDAEVAFSRCDRHGLLYVGRLSPEKGVAGLIRAVAGLADAPLRIIGEGPDEAGLREIATRVQADVVFDGWASRSVVRERMAEASLLCVPSIWYENCPGVVLEAMVAGLPVVASDIGGLAELLDGGRAGWLAAPGDTEAWRRVIGEALGDEERTTQLAARALTRVRQRHDPQRFIERIESIYESLLR